MNIIDWKQEKIKGVLSTFDRIIIKGFSREPHTIIKSRASNIAIRIFSINDNNH